MEDETLREDVGAIPYGHWMSYADVCVAAQSGNRTVQAAAPEVTSCAAPDCQAAGGAPTFSHTLLTCVSSSIVGRPCMRPWPDAFTPP